MIGSSVEQTKQNLLEIKNKIMENKLKKIRKQNRIAFGMVTYVLALSLLLPIGFGELTITIPFVMTMSFMIGVSFTIFIANSI
jgi:hypothetical protein